MSIVKAFVNSVYNLQWLKARKKNVGQAWGYFAVLMAVISLAGVLPVAISMSSGLKELRLKLPAALPEFTATIKDGILSVTDLPQPFVYKDEKNSVIIAVDTVSTSTLSMQDFLENDQQNGVLITAYGTQIYDAKKGETRSWLFRNNFNDAKESSVNRAELIALVNKFTGAGAIAAFSLLLLILFYSISFVGKLFSILAVSFFVWIAVKIAKKDWRFGELFTVSLFAITLPALITWAFNLANIRFGYLQFLSLLAFMAAVVFTKEDKIVPEAVKAETGVENK